MTTRLILRVLAADGSLLAWAEVRAEARGDGHLHPVGIPQWNLESGGDPAILSVHWPDVHVEARMPCSGPIGAMVIPPLRIGEPPTHALPPVTQRKSVSIGVPVGLVGCKVS